MHTNDAIRIIVAEKLQAIGAHAQFSDDDPLFSSGRLDSLAATDLLMHLETSYGLDLADADFDFAQIDSVAGIAALVRSKSKQA